MTTEVASAPPSIYLHTRDVYLLMRQRSKSEPLEDGQTGAVYSGHMTKLIMGPPLNLPMPYYTQIRNALMGMGCAQQLKRGGGSSPSRWVLFHEPSLELYTTWSAAVEASSAKPTSRTSQNEQQIRDLDSRITALETAFTELLAAVGDE